MDNELKHVCVCVYYVFLCSVSLCSDGCPETQSVDQDDLRLKRACPCLQNIVQERKACTITASLKPF